MREIMISIQPQLVEKILNSEKTIEIRKTRPKCELPCKVYIYCTNSKIKYLRKLEAYNKTIFITEDKDILGRTDKVKSILGEYTTFIGSGGFNGRVVAEFTLNHADEFSVFESGSVQYWNCYDLEKSCLSYDDIAKYIGYDKKYGYRNGYAWFIDDLKIYDKPKELSDFTHNVPDYSNGVVMYSLKPEPLKRPFQSWGYVNENN